MSSLEKTYFAFGESKTLSEWIRDPRSVIASRAAFKYRIRSGLSPTEAIEAPSMRTHCWDDLVGERRGKLAITNKRKTDDQGRVYFFCKCDCGGSCWKMAAYLRKPKHSSCGCTKSRTSLEEQKAKNRRTASEWQKKNWGHKKEYLRKWKVENKDKIAAYAVKRRGGWVVHETAIYQECQLPVAIACTYCGKITLDKSDRNVDHATPVSRGGTHEVSNLVVACKFCNLSKHVKTAAEYLIANHKIEEVSFAEV